uniref:NR LBD domain-containing protein n=1 Tax=Caenorhabditis japonica TaxID=281687 RepID=A0A8R1ENP0_CAEJA
MKIAATMSHEMVHVMKRIEMTEEEYSVLLAITLFRPDYRISRDGNKLLEATGNIYSRALAEYCKNREHSELKAMERLGTLMLMLTSVETLTRQEDDNVQYLAIFQHGRPCWSSLRSSFSDAAERFRRIKKFQKFALKPLKSL